MHTVIEKVIYCSCVKSINLVSNEPSAAPAMYTCLYKRHKNKMKQQQQQRSFSCSSRGALAVRSGERGEKKS
jgi:hypothetical protein